MALQRKGIDSGFVNTISKLPSHHVKGASVLLAFIVQGLSWRKSLAIGSKMFNPFAPQRLQILQMVS